MNHINIGFVLDETGSMQHMAQEVRSGFNKYVAGLKEDTDNVYTFSLMQFDSTHQTWVTTRAPLSDVPELDTKNYVPGAMTPLYDAIALCIKTVEPKDEKENTLIVIFTDGLENASAEYKGRDGLEKLNALIKAKETEGWTFMYLGASQEAWENERVFAGTQSASNVYRSTGTSGATATFDSALGSTNAYVASATAGRASRVTHRIVTDADKDAVKKKSN